MFDALRGSLSSAVSHVRAASNEGLRAASNLSTEGQKLARDLGRNALTFTSSFATAAGAAEADENCVDFTYITEQLIAMGFPGSPRCPIDVVSQRLRKRHSGRFMVFNLSEAEYDYEVFEHQVVDIRCPGQPSLPLVQLFNTCLSVQNWLAADPANVAVVHCKTGRGRTNALLACLLAWGSTCSTTQEALTHLARLRAPVLVKSPPAQHESLPPAEAGLLLPALMTPSQRRYTAYFQRVLDGARPDALPLLLRRVIVHGVPTFARRRVRVAVGSGSGVGTASALEGEGDVNKRPGGSEGEDEDGANGEAHGLGAGGGATSARQSELMSEQGARDLDDLFGLGDGEEGEGSQGRTLPGKLKQPAAVFTEQEGCRPVLQIFRGGKLVFSSAMATGGAGPQWISSDEGSFSFRADVLLHGDVTMRLRHAVAESAAAGSSGRAGAAASGAGGMTSMSTSRTMLRASFHAGCECGRGQPAAAPHEATDMNAPQLLRLRRHEIDGACDDERFPEDFFVDLIFSVIATDPDVDLASSAETNAMRGGEQEQGQDRATDAPFHIGAEARAAFTQMSQRSAACYRDMLQQRARLAAHLGAPRTPPEPSQPSQPQPQPLRVAQKSAPPSPPAGLDSEMLAFTAPDSARDGPSPHSPPAVTASSDDDDGNRASSTSSTPFASSGNGTATAISDVENELGLESLLADMQSELDLDFDLDLGSPVGVVGSSSSSGVAAASVTSANDGTSGANSVDLSLALGDDDEFEASLDNFLSTLDK